MTNTLIKCPPIVNLLSHQSKSVNPVEFCHLTSIQERKSSECDAQLNPEASSTQMKSSTATKKLQWQKPASATRDTENPW